MTDSHLLRLARIVYGLACYADEATNKSERLVRESGQLVRDIEAAEYQRTPNSSQLGSSRTITRAQYAWVLEEIARVARDEATPDNAAARVMQVLGLTVEDA